MSEPEESLIEDAIEPAKSTPGIVADADLIRRIVEAALLASSQPLGLAQLYALFPEDAPAPKDSIEQALEALRAETESRGVELVEVASGFRYQVRADVHPWVARLWTERSTRYTRATLETLALIAYRQPITRGEIEQIRGVAVSSNIIKLLEERDWIRVIGHRDVPGRPALFGTTKALLDYFGLKSLDELPPLAEIRDLAELEPQLPFEAHAAAGGGQPPLPPSGTDGATGAGEEPSAEPKVDGETSDEAIPDEEPTNAIGSEETRIDATADSTIEPQPASRDETAIDADALPNLDDATDVVIDPSIPHTADNDSNGASPNDAGDRPASEHIA